MDVVIRPYRAPRWARNPHVQTAAGKYLRPEPDLPVERERWDTPDGDFLDVDLVAPGAVEVGEGATPPLVLVLHGLEGSSARRYVRSALAALAREGVRGVALNFRTCSGEPNRLPRAYHSGETGDPAFVLRRLRERFPGRRVGGMGFSLGGNVLLKLAGEEGRRTAGGEEGLLDAAAAVSVPFDLAAGADRLEGSWMGRIYTRYFMTSLLGKLRSKRSLLEDAVELPRALAARTIRGFDEVVTAPLHGFRDAGHYYRESSSARFLADIRVPTLVLHAMDDPFLPPEAVPVRALRDNPAIHAALPAHGGHVGFLEGTPVRPRFWAETEAARFLAAALRPGRAGGGDGRGREPRPPPVDRGRSPPLP